MSPVLLHVGPKSSSTHIACWHGGKPKCCHASVRKLAPLAGNPVCNVHCLRQSVQSLRNSRQVKTEACTSQACNLPYNLELGAPTPGFASIESALEDLANGKALVVLDDEDRENEGDLIIAADKVTEDAIAFMVEYTSGVICIAMEDKDLKRLRLPLMVSSAENEEVMYTAFTITVDLRDGISTGISAADRANTIRKLADPASLPEEFRRPGHIFPLKYRSPGVLVRPGHTEASVDLARLAGCYPSGVLCEIVNKNGTMARTPQLLKFAEQHGLKCITIADLIRYRLKHEQLVKRAVIVPFQTKFGKFTAHCFESLTDGAEHIALVYGAVASREHVPTILVQACSVLDSLCSVQSNISDALNMVATAGHGVVLYVRGHSQRGETASAQLSKTAALQANDGKTTTSWELDMRDYAVAAQILKHIGPASFALHGSQEQGTALISCGLVIVPGQWAQGANGTNGVHSPPAGYMTGGVKL